jgi:hypothetical protein
MSSEKIKVLYIAGSGRSGSTILGDILGQIDGFCHMGELRYIWERGLIENWLCGCGVPFKECETWKAILDKAFEGKINAHEMMHAFKSGIRIRHTPLLLIPQGRAILMSHLPQHYLSSLRNLYQAIQEVTKSRVIIDSSKLPSYGYTLAMMSNLEVYVIHLIRDSRAVAFSWSRKKLDPGQGRFMSEMGLMKSSLLWLILNIGAETLRYHEKLKYMKIRYEDFIKSPRTIITNIVRFIDEMPFIDEHKMPFIDEHTIRMRFNHTVSGNPSRFQHGTVKLKADIEWIRSMPKHDRVFVTFMTWPLLLRYKYFDSVTL